MMTTPSRSDSRQHPFGAFGVTLGVILAAFSIVGATTLVAGALGPRVGGQTTTTTTSGGTTTTTSSTGGPTTTTTSSTGGPTTTTTSATTTTTTQRKVTTTTLRVTRPPTTTTGATPTIAPTTTSTTSKPTTTSGATTTSTVAPTTTTTTVFSSSGRLSIHIVASAGAPLVHGRILVRGAGLLPGSSASIFVHSTPVLIGAAPVDGEGRFSIGLTMPAKLAVGPHQIVVTGLTVGARHVSAQENFTVAQGGLYGTVGSIPPGPLAGYVSFDPSSDPLSLLVLFAGLTVVIAAVGSVLRPRRRGGRSHNARESYLEDVELEREEREISGGSRGDRSGTWRWPGTPHVDQWSRLLPSRISAISPVAGRVAVDGDYLRSMFGSAWLVACAASIGLGLDAAARVGWYAVPPPLNLFLAILGVSVLDATLGYLAGLAFVFGAIIAGHVASASQWREAAGLVLVWFAVPLAAAALRPLRRNVHRTVDGLWERSADLVLAGLFGAWAATKMTAALSGFAGYRLPIGDDVDVVAIWVIGFLALRIVIETVAAHHYPRRLAAVHHVGELDSGSLQVGLSLVVQIAVFVFVATAFLGVNWALYAGTAVFFTPLVPWLFADRIPKSRLVTTWMPRGVAKWSFVIVAGLALASLLKTVVTGDVQLVRVGFVLLALPIVICWSLELFEEESDRVIELSSPATLPPRSKPTRRRVWLLRCTGVALLGLTVVVVVHGVS